MTQKTIFIALLILMLSSLALSAQVQIGFEYTYDANGNRAQREFQSPLIKMGTYETYETKLDEYNIQIFPNPTDGGLEVSIENLDDDNVATVEFYNINGGKLFKTKGIKETTQLDLSKQPNGVYVLRIIIDGKIGDWKVIKQE